MKVEDPTEQSCAVGGGVDRKGLFQLDGRMQGTALLRTSLTEGLWNVW